MMHISGKHKHGQGETCDCYSYSHGKLLGISLLVIGLYFIASDFGWLPVELPIWSIVALVVGLVLVFGKAHRG